MAELRIDDDEFKRLVKQIVSETLQELDQFRLATNGKLALTEQEAAELLGLHSWQLRDLRLARKIAHSRIVGNKVRYLVRDLFDYLRHGHQKGSA